MVLGSFTVKLFNWKRCRVERDQEIGSYSCGEGGCSIFFKKKEKRKKKTHLSPSFTHFTNIRLGSQRFLALAFSTLLCRRIVKRTLFYIGNFKTIVTLCVKNVQRNL